MSGPLLRQAFRVFASLTQEKNLNPLEELVTQFRSPPTVSQGMLKKRIAEKAVMLRDTAGARYARCEHGIGPTQLFIMWL